MRQNKDLERRFDSIRSERALVIEAERAMAAGQLDNFLAVLEDLGRP